jgi:hypothetical protein
MGSLIQREKTCFSPEALALAQHAFEQSWTEIAPRFTAARHEEVRNILAVAIMSAVRVDSNDVAPLCKVGLQAMERKYPVEMQLRMGVPRGEASENDFKPHDV